MFIFIGGLVGTGKTVLAKRVAENLNIFYYEIDKAKAEVINANPVLQYNMRYNKPYAEEPKLMIYSRAFEHLRELSKTHGHVIADEDFHKKHSRQIFFERVRESLGVCLVVWVKADEELIIERLTARQREGHLLKEPVGMYLAMKMALNAFDDADIQFENNEPLDMAAEKLTKLIKEKLK